MSDGSPLAIFYVYILFDEFAIPRYVGKGKGSRWKDHEGKTKSSNRIKNKFIRETIAAIGEIPKIKIRENLLEHEAFEIEVALIRALGRLDLRTGILTNMSDGGSGGNFGNLVRKAKSKWTPQQRREAGERSRNVMRKYWSSISEEEKCRMLNPALQRYKILRDTDPEFEINRAKKIREGHARRTPIEKAIATAKMLETFSPEERSKTITRFHASQTPEERSMRVRGSLTPEELSERSKRAAAKRNPEERRNQIIRQQANLTKEQKEARISRASNLAKNTRWITDGKHSRRLKNTESLPEGWNYGRLSKARSNANHCISSALSGTTTSLP